jgi:hypothetical protein
MFKKTFDVPMPSSASLKNCVGCVGLKEVGLGKGYTVPKIWQISISEEEEVPYRRNFPVILGN